MSASPASSGDRPRSLTSINGTSSSTEKKAPVASPRSATTVGSPRAARSVPIGSSRGSVTARRTRPATSTSVRPPLPYCTNPAPAAASVAQPILPSRPAAASL